MRRARIKEAGAVYHCVSRTVGGQFLLDDLAKQRLVDLLFPLAQFCGVEIITYCMMSNNKRCIAAKRSGASNYAVG